MNHKVMLPALVSLALTACGGSGSGDAPPPVNQAPAISAIADQSLKANQSGPEIAFVVSDESPGNLTLGLSSSNGNLVPTTRLTLAGSGANRTLTISPLPDTTGEAFITVDATDREGLTTSTTFLATVSPEQKSLQAFTRMMFGADENDVPALVNAIEFVEDVGDDDFADLFSQ